MTYCSSFTVQNGFQPDQMRGDEAPLLGNFAIKVAIEYEAKHIDVYINNAIIKRITSKKQPFSWIFLAIITPRGDCKRSARSLALPHRDIGGSPKSQLKQINMRQNMFHNFTQQIDARRTAHCARCSINSIKKGPVWIFDPLLSAQQAVKRDWSLNVESGQSHLYHI